MHLSRSAMEPLLAWRRRRARKPMLVDGARQVGKSWLVGRLFGPTEFRRVHWLDFLAEPHLADLFADSLDPSAILRSIEIEVGADVDVERDLVFFDEIGECQRALDSLKYFAERMPHAFVCATGSNIGLLRSFPVGSVEQLRLFPLSFDEFLMASDQPLLLAAYRQGIGRTPEGGSARAAALHRRLWSMLLDYYFVGGMPEAVSAWFDGGESAAARVQSVTDIHRNLIDGYRRDFGKYSGRDDARHIERVFDSVPAQLASRRDGSVARYRFKGVIPGKERYRDLAGPIEWLERARLVWKCLPIEGRPEPPFSVRAKPNRFRLYLFDVGLLGHMLGMTCADQRRQQASYKGFVAENFVQTELGGRMLSPTYGWFEARAEIEFLLRDQDGEVVPVEVKSGSRTRARSLRSYMERYRPRRAIKLAGTAGGNDGRVETWPLYDAAGLAQL